jgi:hypothetical protein
MERTVMGIGSPCCRTAELEQQTIFVGACLAKGIPDFGGLGAEEGDPTLYHVGRAKYRKRLVTVGVTDAAGHAVGKWLTKGSPRPHHGLRADKQVCKSCMNMCFLFAPSRLYMVI